MFKTVKHGNVNRTRCRPLGSIPLVIAAIAGGCSDPSTPLNQPEPRRQQEIATQPIQRPAPAPVDPASLREQTAAALEAGDPGKAFELIRRARRADPDDPQGIYLMARVLAERNRFAEAIKMLDDLAESAPEARLPSLGQTAQWLVLQGNWAEAESRYRILLDEVEDTLLVDRMLSQLLMRQGRRQEAATHLHKLCRRGDVEESNLRSLLMIANAMQGDVVQDSFEPIGALGHARYQISLGNWRAALEQLGPSAADAETAALGARIHAHLQDFDSLGEWIEDPASKAARALPDYWFANGVHKAHQGDHRGATQCFCEVVLRDQTDADAYRFLAQSLRKLGQSEQADEAARRAKMIQRTQSIGREMAGGDGQEVARMNELVELLQQLRRPFEALAWRAVQIYYERLSGALADDKSMQVMGEINRTRQELLEKGAVDETQFILCGVNLESL